MKKIFLLFNLVCSIGIAQNVNDDLLSLKINKLIEKQNPNCFFIDKNQVINLPLEGGFVYSSFESNGTLNYSGYADNEDYTVTFNSLDARKLVLKTQFFNTEKDVDVLEIYDGNSTNSKLINLLSGIEDGNTMIISSGTSLTLRFKSNQEKNYKGFRFRIDNGNPINLKTGPLLPTPQSCAGTPASDECSGAPLICNLNGYCGNTSSSYSAGNTSGLGSFCGSIENNSWIKFVANNSSASLNIISGGCQSTSSGIQAAMYATTDCSNYTQVSSCVSQSSGSGSFNIASNVSLVVGQTYYVMIDGYAGNVCNYTVTAQSGVNTSAAQINSSQSQVCPGFTTSLSSGVTALSANGYTWTSNPSGTYPNTQTITVAPASTTIYTLTIAPSQCSTVQTVAITTIVVTSTLSPANITAPNLVCYGSNVNIASLTNGGTYMWTGPGGFTSSTQNNTIPNWSSANNGNYSLTINYGSGCATTPTAVSITGVNPPVVTITPNTATLCAGQSLTVTAGGGTGNNPYLWNWNILETSIVLQSCPFGVCVNNPLYSIIPETSSAGPKAVITPNVTTQVCASTTNSTGCKANACVNITVNTCSTTSCPTLTLSVASQTNVNCFGANTGAASISTSGGAGSYTYTWMPGNLTGASQSALVAGVYSVSTKDANNCTGSFTFAITQPTAAIALTLVGTTPASCGSASGSATVLATGGTPIYNYTWVPTGGGSAMASSLNAGTYTVGVIDIKGCFTITTVNINSAGGPTVSIASQQNVNCFGANSGSATINAIGGTSPYTYTWSPGNLSGATQTSLTAGIYNISVSDNTGCIGTASLSITQPTAALSAIISSSNTSCGGNTGSATVTVSGGAPTYNYNWLPSGGSSNTANALGVGNYTVTVTDSKNCKITSTTSIASTGGSSTTLSIASQSNVTCFAGNNGSATINATGGTGFTYTWLPSGGNTASASNLVAGTYTILVGASGCVTSTLVTITQPAIINITINTTSAVCTASNGAASVSAVGGTNTYTYTWSDGSNGTSISNVIAGTYSVGLIDDNGCIATSGAIIGTSPGSFSVDAGLGTIIELGTSTTLNGIIPTGATYTWSPSNTLSCANCLTPVATPNQTTVYTLSGKDANGCAANDNVTIEVHIPCGELFVPTAFSPNNDGSNDVLFVYGNCVTELEFVIFDRWGEKVFETNSQTLGWDGMYKGKDMGAGSFAYYVKANVNGVAIVKKGAVALVK